MPVVEAELLRQHYEDADAILEYGSGGSTLMAAEMEGKHVTSVESDKAWWQMMMECFEANPASIVYCRHALFPNRTNARMELPRGRAFLETVCTVFIGCVGDG